jgi:putative transposase
MKPAEPVTNTSTENDSILEFDNKESVSDVLSELLREGAQQLIHQEVELELSDYLFYHQCLTADGRMALDRNGYLPKREILTGWAQSVFEFPRYAQEMVNHSLSVLHCFHLMTAKRDP